MTGYESKKAMAQAKLDSMEREALKLALDLATMHHTDDGYAELRSKVRQFAKEALAQPAQEPVAVWELQEDGWDTICDGDWLKTLPVGTKLYTTTPKRQPLTDDEINKCDMCGYVGKDKDSIGQCPKCRWDELRPLVEKARQKPLTDDQIYDMYNEPRSDAEMLEFARAIEAALGIKE
jgi:hypothetical protein